MAQKKIILNEMTGNDHGAVHHVLEGILLVMPDSWDLFLSDHLGIHDDWQVLTQSLYTFIKTPQQTFIHQYCAGQWPHRRVIKGLLVKPARLFSPNNLLEINSQLILDPSVTERGDVV